MAKISIIDQIWRQLKQNLRRSKTFKYVKTQFIKKTSFWKEKPLITPSHQFSPLSSEGMLRFNCKIELLNQLTIQHFWICFIFGNLNVKTKLEFKLNEHIYKFLVSLLFWVFARKNGCILSFHWQRLQVINSMKLHWIEYISSF